MFQPQILITLTQIGIDTIDIVNATSSNFVDITIGVSKAVCLLPYHYICWVALGTGQEIQRGKN